MSQIENFVQGIAQKQKQKKLEAAIISKARLLLAELIEKHLGKTFSIEHSVSNGHGGCVYFYIYSSIFPSFKVCLYIDHITHPDQIEQMTLDSFSHIDWITTR